MRRRRMLTDRQCRWLWEYTRTGSNASQAAKIVYGGTPISVRVKGHNQKVKLKPFLDKIDKIWDGLLEVDPNGSGGWKNTSEEVEGEVDAYLKRLERKTHKNL